MYAPSSTRRTYNYTNFGNELQGNTFVTIRCLEMNCYFTLLLAVWNGYHRSRSKIRRERDESREKIKKIRLNVIPHLIETCVLMNPIGKVLFESNLCSTSVSVRNVNLPLKGSPSLFLLILDKFCRKTYDALFIHELYCNSRAEQSDSRVVSFNNT